MDLLYHIVSVADWATFEGKPAYEAASLQTEGFIHLSLKEQVAGVLDRYYRQRQDLLLLHLEPARLIHDVKFEVSTNNERFPHLYGPINKEAVIAVEPLR